jgi:hypothetical protein
MAKIICSDPGPQPLDLTDRPSPLSVVQVQQVHYEETARHKEWTFQLSTGELKVVQLLSNPKTNKERSANKASSEFLQSVIGLKSAEPHSPRQRRRTRRETRQLGKKLKAAAKRNDLRQRD